MYNEKEMREWKSNTFSLLMKEAKYALQTYNCLNGTEYTDENSVEILEVDGGFSLSVRNDATFIIDSVMNLYEHQSTVNNNMPLRLLIYVGTVYKHLTKDKNIYGKKKISIPTPRFVVFYNGKDKCPERQELKLSDSYKKEEDNPWLELKCLVLNVNPGYNEDLKKNCEAIRGYMEYVEKVRAYSGEMDLIDAIAKAIDECIAESYLPEFFRENRSMIITADALDYTYERRLVLELDDAKEEFFSEGREKGHIEAKAKYQKIIDNLVKEKDNALQEKDSALKEKDNVLQEKDKRIAELEALLQAKRK